MRNDNCKKTKKQLRKLILQSSKFPNPGRAVNLDDSFQYSLEVYFTCHTSEDTDRTLSELVQSYICGDGEAIRSAIQMSDMAFFVHNLTEVLKCIGDLSSVGCTTNLSINSEIESFYDQIGYDFANKILCNALQAWIAPCDYTEIFTNNLADAIGGFWMINKLIRQCEGIYLQNKLIGGVSC